jgi:hypothetical protein
MGIQNGTFAMDAVVNYIPAAANITGGQSIPVNREFSAYGMSGHWPSTVSPLRKP